MAQINYMDSVAGGGYVEKTSGANWMSYLLAPTEANQEFVLKESLTSSPSCYGYIYVNDDGQTGAICYLPSGKVALVYENNEMMEKSEKEQEALDKDTY